MPASHATQTVLRFGPFDVDLQTQELRKRGVRLRLPGQAFLVLKMLLERPSQLVTRDELRAALWPSDTFVDFDNGLNTAVNRLRETLGDSADSPHLIETLPRRGYRFIAPVDGLGTGPDNEDVRQPGKVRLAPQLRRWLTALLLLTIVAIALSAWKVFHVRDRLTGNMRAPRIQSLAVLPLTNLSGDPAQEFFSDGMTDALITDLAKMGSVKVISRTSAFRYKNRAIEPQKWRVNWA